MNIAQILTEQAALRPNAAAIIERRAFSFAEMERSSGRAAAMLRSAGLRSGDRVLVLQPMSAELYIALTAIFRLGLVAMFLDPSAGRDHAARCCELAPPAGFIGSAKAQLLCLLNPSLRRIPHKFVIGPALPGAMTWSASAHMEPMVDIAPVSNDTPALITFTSGSTGRPKAAVRTHGFLLAQHRALAATIGLPAGAIELATLPIFALANLAAGLTSVIPDADLRAPGRVDPIPILAQIEAVKPTRVTASPAFLERLADRCERDGRLLSAFRQIFTGGAPVFPRLLDKLRRVAPQAEIVAIYGSTEAEPIAEVALDAIEPRDREAMLGGKGLLAGSPVSVIDLRILRDRWGKPAGPYSEAEFIADCMPVGEPGEIVVSGAHVLAGYLNGEGDAETKIRVDGIVWHRTGDAGYLDDRGRLWLLGRCSAIVNDARGALYPFAVECAAQEVTGARRAALLSRQGERLLAVEPEPGASIDTDAVLGALAWARLDRILPVRQIPLDRRHNAKVDYPALARLLEKPGRRVVKRPGTPEYYNDALQRTTIPPRSSNYLRR
jgi:acyl-CoA synthetase (AMP-forming)/AMP-acid ligase II